MVASLAHMAAVFAVVCLVAGCQPRDVTPGLWLRGEVVTLPVESWQFTDDVDEVFIETRPWYAIAHSTTIWCVQLEGNLYIGSYGDDVKAWETHVLRNPSARMSISGGLYEVLVTELDNPAVNHEVRAAYDSKYDMEAVFGAEIPEWRFYRVTQSR